MKSLFVVLLFAVTCTCAHAQTSEADIAARLVGKPLLLRGFWAEDKLRFDATGKPMGTYRLTTFTECGMDVTAVHLHGNRLSIEGQRVGLTFDRDGSAGRVPLSQGRGLFDKPEKLAIQIEQDAPDFGPALDAIFATTLAEITPTLPDCWQRFAHEHFLHEPPQPKPARTDPVAASGVSHISGSVKPPHVLHQVDPSFTDAARSRKFSGKVEVYLWVEKDGIPSHIRLIRPVGLGLDEAAVAAVSQYRFAPATRNGEPVVVDIYIDVNFQIF